jgi:hypothetical protein
MKALLPFCVLAAILPAAAHAKPRAARCVVSSAGEKPYSGPCRFLPEAKGSFSVEPVGRRLFFGEIARVEVSRTARGSAEVRGLTTEGIDSRWGSARRSRRDTACWDGEDFRICVY